MTRPENTPALEAERSESGAVVVSEAQYHGRPCKNCGGTPRWRCNGKCVECTTRRMREWREKRGGDPKWVESERQRKREHIREKRRRDPEYAERLRERKRKWVLAAIERGLCANCRQPKLSEWYCWDCLNKVNDRNLRRSIDAIGI